MSETIHHSIVVVGGGTAGISVAARLTNGWFNKRDVAVIEPADMVNLRWQSLTATKSLKKRSQSTSRRNAGACGL